MQEDYQDATEAQQLECEEQEQAVNIIADSDLLRAVRDLRFLAKKEKELKAKREKLKGIFEEKMGDAPRLIDSDGVLLLTFAYSKDGYTFDAERFKKEKPTLYKSYLKPKKGHRTLLLKDK
jgi:hypothetical protein